MENQTFNFTYSAAQQEEIKAIREKYLPQENVEDKMEILRKLDAGATNKASIYALALGIISTLVLGVGMCCCLVWDLFVLGIVVGIVGIVGIAFAYPVYSRTLKKERERIAPEIIRLTDELMK